MSSGSSPGTNANLEPLRLGNPQIAADFAREMVVYLTMLRDGTALTQGWVVPPRVIAAFTQELTPQRREMAE